MSLPTLILASASPRRHELLKSMGVNFRVVVGDTQETAAPHLSPQEITQWNAQRKARQIANQFPESLILGADTVVCLENEVLGKPQDLPEAIRMLTRLQGREHEVITGVCLLRRKPAWCRLFTEVTRVRFRPLNLRQIQDYLGKIHPLDKAGAYAIQEHGDQIVAGISGSFSNVVGLPVERLAECLGQIT